jgi:hypothetical protein
MNVQNTLQIKFYKYFKGDEDLILVIGDSNAYKKASDLFKKLSGCSLLTSSAFTIEDLGHIHPNEVLFTPEECLSFARICDDIAKQNRGAHDYFSIKSLPDVDFLISYSEYATLP